MRLLKRRLPLVALLAAVFAIATPAVSLGSPTVEAIAEGLYETVRWSPPEVAVTTGGSVTFLNSSSTISHGIVWTSPVTPTCANTVPVGLHNFATGWNGACTFAQTGEYTYYCSFHGPSMHGVVYANASGSLPPIATTGAATGPTQTEATLHGTVNPNGQPTSYYFNYGTTAAYGQKSTEAPVGTDGVAHPESATVTGLLPGTVYHFQIVATYAAGASIVRGTDQTFTTASPPGAPSASTGDATALSETGATISGTVNPHGQATTYFFNYGLTDGYGETTVVQSVGEDSTGHIVSASLTGLLPGTLYHFELVAHNASGSAPGLDRTFITTSPPSPPETPTTTPTVTPPPILSGASTPPPSSSGATPGLLGGGSPLAGSASTAVKVARTQHGTSVRGSLAIAPAGAGGRLEVDLLAASASLARQHPGKVTIGRFVRPSLVAGKVSFAVSLTARAKRALHRRHHLPVAVQIVLTPLHGTPIAATRSVTLRL